jgi:hypothetical protein
MRDLDSIAARGARPRFPNSGLAGIERQARLVGSTAWAFGKLKAHDQLLQLEPLLDELEYENRIDWDNLTAGRAIAGESQ